MSPSTDTGEGTSASQEDSGINVSTFSNSIIVSCAYKSSFETNKSYLQSVFLCHSHNLHKILSPGSRHSQTPLKTPLKSSHFPQVYLWGLNDKEQLGGLRGSKVKTPTLSPVFTELGVTHVAGGSKSLFACTSDGKVGLQSPPWTDIQSSGFHCIVVL